METASQAFAPKIGPEDQARSDFYALLSRLFESAPDAGLLAAIAAADELPDVSTAGIGCDLAKAWRELIAASAAMDAEAAAAEYQDLFIGVGRSEVSLNAAAYAKPGSANPLVAVRSALAVLGLARQTGVNTYEDHLAAVCETMRMLIIGVKGAKAYPFVEQRGFFEAHVRPWVFDCCSAIESSPVANYYRRVAEFTETFMALERDSFAIE